MRWRCKDRSRDKKNAVLNITWLIQSANEQLCLWRREKSECSLFQVFFLGMVWIFWREGNLLISLGSSFKLSASDRKVSDQTVLTKASVNCLKKVMSCVRHTKSLGYIAISHDDPWEWVMKKSHQQSPPLEKQTQCARLKAMASESVC